MVLEPMTSYGANDAWGVDIVGGNLAVVGKHTSDYVQMRRVHRREALREVRPLKVGTGKVMAMSHTIHLRRLPPRAMPVQAMSHKHPVHVQRCSWIRGYEQHNETGFT